MHDLPLVKTIAAGLALACILGVLAKKLRLSPIVGYLIAGVLIGPHTPGFVGDQHLAFQVAEIGVILLMFGVGLHFSLKELLHVKNIAIPGALVQTTVATVLGVLLAQMFGWGAKAGVVFGLAMAVASTVVLVRVLTDRHMVNSLPGHVAVGWLIVEDIITVVALVLIPTLATTSALDQAGGNSLLELGIALGKLILFVGIMALMGAKIIPWLLVHVAGLRSRELFTLSVLVLSVAVATGAMVVFGASVALGAFVAGMVVGRSPVSQQAASDLLPMRDAFGVLFFVSVGMLFDPSFLLTHPMFIVGGLAVVMIAKPLAALFIVAFLGHSPRIAFTAALGLAQIGEFSFILSQLARQYDIIPGEAHHVLVACSMVSISINPFLFSKLDQIESLLKRVPWLWKWITCKYEKKNQLVNQTSTEQVAQENKPHAIIIGYGPVGQTIGRVLKQAGIPLVVIDLNMDTVTSLVQKGETAFYGDGTSHEVLEQAGIAKASHLVVTIPDSQNRSSLVTMARQANESIQIVVRARFLQERGVLEQSGADRFVFEEAETALSMAKMVLTDMGMDQRAVKREVVAIRQELMK